jgi:Tol biopolymer transport system component
MEMDHRINLEQNSQGGFMLKRNTLITVLCIATMVLAVSTALAFTTGIVSNAFNGKGGNDDSHNNDISADGRYVLFSSFADNLVPGDNNDELDLFVHDRATGRTGRVNISSSGEEADKGTSIIGSSISANGTHAAFISKADNLAPGETNGKNNVFVRDMVSGTTERITPTGGLTYNPSLSADGRYVAFDSMTAFVAGDYWDTDVYVYDRVNRTFEIVSVTGTGGDASGANAEISDDGRYVAFGSASASLGTNGFYQVFVHDRVTGENDMVSVNSLGEQGNNDSTGASISADGRYVAFSSEADNLVAGDTNGTPYGNLDTFVHDRVTGTTVRVSVNSNGNELTCWSGQQSDITANGAFVAFKCGNHFYVHELATGTTTVADVSSTGELSNGIGMYFPSISDDGAVVSFSSRATNLVDGDTNEAIDVFVNDASQ